MEYWMKRGFNLHGTKDQWGNPSKDVYVVSNGAKSAVVVVLFDGTYQKTTDWMSSVDAAKREAVQFASNKALSFS